MSGNRMLITGINGTIGTRLCEKLLQSGYDLVGVDYRANIWNDEINKITILGDLRSDKTIKKIPKNIDSVIHLAANARVYNLVLNPSLAKDNLITLYNVLEFCRKNSIKKFIFASSREVYGNSEKIVHSENEAYVRDCESPYTASKIGGEALIHAYNQCFGLNFVILRFSNVYGMYDNSDRLIPLFIRLTKGNKNLIVYGKEKFLDFTYIDDAISGIMGCIKNFDRIKNDVFNIASGEGTSIFEIAQLIRKYMNGNNKIVIKENRPGEITKFVADISKAKNKINFEPKNSIKQGMRKTVKWYEENSKEG